MVSGCTSVQPGGELPPTGAAARATHAGIQVSRAGPAFPRSLWSHRAALPTSTPPLARPCVPSRDAATIPYLARSDERTDRSVEVTMEAVMHLMPGKYVGKQ
jgi:hypothetical protein